MNITLHVIELGSLSDYNRELNSIFNWVYCALFWKNGRARVRFWLLCARARFDQDQSLHAVLKLAVLHFLFSSLLSQITPSMRTSPHAHVFGSRAHVQALIKFKLCVQS
jgi:hypothetical protein